MRVRVCLSVCVYMHVYYIVQPFPRSPRSRDNISSATFNGFISSNGEVCGASQIVSNVGKNACSTTSSISLQGSCFKFRSLIQLKTTLKNSKSTVFTTNNSHLTRF